MEFALNRSCLIGADDSYSQIVEGRSFLMPGRRRIDLINYLVIGAGGFIGAITRYIIGTWIGQNWGRSFPMGTFFINVSGSFLIGLLMTLLAEKYMVNPQWRLFLVVGFLGAYTTFSTFEYETANLLKDGELLLAALNVILSFFGGFAALKVGQMLVQLG
jgi:CrcB protein